MYSTTKPLFRRLSEMLPTFCGIAVTCCALQAHADDYFNPALLDIDNPEQAKTDLSVYENGPGQAPGKYQVTMFVNNNKIDTRDVLFTLQKDAQGDWRSFDLTLSKCPTTSVLATATFHGQPDSLHPTKFASTGTAKGLALELADPQDQISLAPDASFSVLINQDNHTADFPLAARYYATSLPVTAGTFSSVVQVTFIYQ